MSAYLSFLQVFFSNEFTKFLNLKEIATYRQICKETRDLHINILTTHSIFALLQLKNIIPYHVDYHIIGNTTIDVKFRDIYRYLNVFNYKELYRHSETYILSIDNLFVSDITDEQKQQLIDNDKRHYICVSYSDDDNIYHRYALCFSSHQELLYTVTDIMDSFEFFSFYGYSEVYTVFSMIVDDKYPNCVFFKFSEEDSDWSD
jgi:hypothetical protein